MYHDNETVVLVTFCQSLFGGVLGKAGDAYARNMIVATLIDLGVNKASCPASKCCAYTTWRPDVARH